MSEGQVREVILRCRSAIRLVDVIVMDPCPEARAVATFARQVLDVLGVGHEEGRSKGCGCIYGIHCLDGELLGLFDGLDDDAP